MTFETEEIIGARAYLTTDQGQLHCSAGDNARRSLTGGAMRRSPG
jgi:hypothetical protein